MRNFADNRSAHIAATPTCACGRRLLRVEEKLLGSCTRCDIKELQAAKLRNPTTFSLAREQYLAELLNSL